MKIQWKQGLLKKLKIGFIVVQRIISVLQKENRIEIFRISYTRWTLDELWVLAEATSVGTML